MADDGGMDRWIGEREREKGSRGKKEDRSNKKSVNGFQE